MPRSARMFRLVLTADEARAMVTRLIASKSRDQRLADLLNG
jgi:hypothetical protein